MTSIDHVKDIDVLSDDGGVRVHVPHDITMHNSIEVCTAVKKKGLGGARTATARHSGSQRSPPHRQFGSWRTDGDLGVHQSVGRAAGAIRAGRGAAALIGADRYHSPVRGW